MPRQPAQLLAAILLSAAADAALAQQATYETVAPILAARCTMCHAGPSAAAELRLDSPDGLLKGGRSGPVIRPGRPGESELILRLKGTKQPRMPMTGPPFLSEDEVALFERWIESGAPAGSSKASAAAPPRAAAAVPTYADVAPIFATRCARCHAEKGQMGPAPEGYLLTSYAATTTLVDRARVVSGSSSASELVRRIRGLARPRMPLDGPPYLSEEEIALIVRWIDAGARDASGRPAARPTGARVRLHGTLRADGRLDDLRVRVPSTARTDGAAAGAYVEMRGQVGDDGLVVADRIRRR